MLKPGLVKGPWKQEEDAVIIRCLQSGVTKWSEIADHIPGRIGKQCRERYFNHLDRASAGRVCGGQEQGRGVGRRRGRLEASACACVRRGRSLLA